MGKLMKTLRLAVLGVPLLVSFTAQAVICEPRLHNDITIDSENLRFSESGNEFTVKPDGNLLFAVHPVALSDEQKASLATYSQMVRRDLPYFSESLSRELFTTWQAIDQVLRSELGERSQLRSEFGQFHHYLQTQVDSALYDANRQHRLDHEALEQTVKELELSIPQFIATVTSRGLMDLAVESADKPNKMEYISTRMANLQSQLTSELKQQRERTEPIGEELCQRLAGWQVQEQKIQSLIPALKSWKTVTVQ